MPPPPSFVPAMVYRGTSTEVVRSDQSMGSRFEYDLSLLRYSAVMLLEEMRQAHDAIERRHCGDGVQRKVTHAHIDMCAPFFFFAGAVPLPPPSSDSLSPSHDSDSERG